MSAVLSMGEKIHVIHRQLYESDTRRHFVGTVDVCDGSLARVTGHLFTARIPGNEFARHDVRLRTRIIALDSGMLLINVLPASVDIEKITYEQDGSNHILVTDGSDRTLDLSHL
jgi:hypothetical protein